MSYICVSQLENKQIIFIMRYITIILLLALSTQFSKAERITIDKTQSPYNNTEVITEQNNEILLSVKVNSFELEDIKIKGVTHQVLKANGLSQAFEAGQPDVLKMAFSLQIPNNLWLNDFEIVSSDFIEYQNINLAPARRVIYRNENPEDVSYEKGASYTQNSFYPQNAVEIGDPFIFRDKRGESVVVRPFQYNPVTKVLRVYTQMILKISGKNELGINVLKNSNQNSLNSEFEQLYKRLFVNYHNTQDRYTTLVDQGKLLIIAHDDYINDINDFANWKRQRGIETEIVNLATTGTTANDIKNYIANEYNTNGLTYVILVGDNTHIPSLTSNGDSDQAYAQISGSDHYPELIIGRFSVESADDIATMTQRSIWYERDLTTADSWLEEGIGLASDEGGSSSDDGETDQAHMENIRTKLLGYGYTAVEQDYDNNNITSSILSNHIVKGVGVINYVGHGSDYSWVTSGFNNTDVNNLTNSNKLPFIFDVACVNGNFHGQTCFAEAWTRATHNGAPTGAVAIIASTVNQPWSPPMDGQDEMVDILTENYPNNIKRTFGGISYNGVMHMLDEYPSDNGLTADTWTIFGDPSLHVRTKTPIVLTETHASTLSIGVTSFTVNSTVEGALVALTKLDLNNDVLIIGTGHISGGTANITILPFDAPGEMTVTVTGYNYIPAVSAVQVIAPSGPYLVYDNHSINDATANNNNEADFGESILLNLAINNVGVDISNNADVTISSANANITITDAIEDYGTVNAAQIKNMTDAFALTISDAIQDQESIMFDLSITDDDGTYNGSFNMVANAPSLELEFVSIDDASGNDNGILDAGENVTIQIKAKNIGHAAISAAILSASESSIYFNLTNTTENITILDALNGVYLVDFNGTVEAIVPEGESVDFSFQLNAGNYTASLAYNLPIGISVEDWESDSFDDYDWTNTSSTPWSIVSDVVFEGTYSSKSGSIGNSATSMLSIELDVLSADSISFYKKVSCEDSQYSDNNYWYDFLQFDIDASEKGKWDAEIDWTREAYYVGTGTKTLKWTYSKDYTTTGGSDCAWIDYIILPPHSTSTVIRYQSEIENKDFSVFPNPSNGQFNISYALDVDNEITIDIKDVSGKLIKTIINGEQNKGTYQIDVHGLNLESGIYFVNFIKNNNSSVKKFIVK